MRLIPASERIVSTACAIGGFDMKFSELLDQYLTLREEMQHEDYYQRRGIEERRNIREHCEYLLEEMDKIVEGVNRAEQS